MNPVPSVYPLFEARGAPVELGRQHGEQAAAQVRGFLDFLAHGLRLSREQLQERALQFRPLFARHCPHLLDEVAGLAAGAGITEAEALAVQLRGELGPLSGLSTNDGGCTTFVIGPRGTTTGEPLIGQTSDNPAELMDYGYVLRVVPEGRPRFVMWTFGGMLGYHGVNEHGVSHFANALGGGPEWKFALSHYPIKRMIFERRTVAEVLALMRDVPVCSNGNYVLCDNQGAIADVELTSDGPHLLEDDGAGSLAHSNHYLCDAHSCDANFAKSLPDSFSRLDRMRSLIASRFGRIDVATMREFLSDHASYPVGICRHPHCGPDEPMLPASGRTVAALIAEPAHGRLHVTRGNPCENAFTTYSLA